mgnify:FL=1
MLQNESEVVCPACDKKITPKYGINETRQLTSLEYQSKRLGCSVECPYCGHVFIYKSHDDDKQVS